MKPRPAWLRVHHGGRDFDQGGRDWLRRLSCASPRPERRARSLPPFRWGKLVAFSAMAVGLVALFSPSLPLLAPLFLPSPAAGLVGYARVVDGDTIDLQGTRIRLHGIDAPEMDQQCRRGPGAAAVPYSCGRDAKTALEGIIGGGTVACEPRDHDRYGRTVAACVADGLDVGRELVRQGWAVAYTRYSLDYVIDEVVARAAKRSLWAGDFESPEEWRRHHRSR